MEQYAFREGYGVCTGGGGCWATGVPGGSGTVVRVARSWLEGDGPVPGPVPAAVAAAGFGTAFGGKLIANKKTKTNARLYRYLQIN